MTINERVRMVRKSLNLSQEVFGRKIGLGQGGASFIEQENTTVTEQNIILICKIFDVNEEWLRTGEGEMFNFSDKNFNEFYEIYKNLSTPLQDFLIQSANNLIDLQNKL